MTEYRECPFLPPIELIQESVRQALEEDIGAGDVSAALIKANTQASAKVITREDCVISGRPWVEECFRQVDQGCELEWVFTDGEIAKANSILFTVHGPARALLSAERCALNFLQTLSANATLTADFVTALGDDTIRILDTRKTLPGLRLAQKYAVRCGGGHNHRIGLFDAFLLKENHIASAGGIGPVVAEAKRQRGDLPVEVEVENLDEFDQALAAEADIIMLDNFTIEDIEIAVLRNQKRAKLEVSGNISLETIGLYKGCGVDFISIGALTKHCRAVDLSMRVELKET